MKEVKTMIRALAGVGLAFVLLAGGSAAASGVAQHPTGRAWLDPVSPNFHGRSPISCADCHDEASDCLRCHFGPGGAREPQGSRWRHGARGHEHLQRFGAVCRRCHEIERGWGGGPGRCHDCHGEGDDDGEGRRHRSGRERGRHRDDHEQEEGDDD